MILINVALGASGSAVSCNGLNCGFCSFLETLSGTYNIILALAFVFAVLIAVIAGFSYVFSFGSRSFQKKSKSILLGTLIGFAFVILGWVVIHGFFSVLNYKNQGSWWQFKCEKEFQNTPPTEDKTATIQYNNQNGNKITTYLTLGQYLESTDKTAQISGLLAASLFMDQLQNLKEGEYLTFSAPGVQSFSNGNKEVYAPLLTVTKQNGLIKVEDIGGTLDKYLASSLEEISKTNPSLSNTISNYLSGTTNTGDQGIGSTTSDLSNVLLTDLKGNTINTASSAFNNDDMVGLLTEMVKEDTLKKAKTNYNSDISSLIENSLSNTNNPEVTKQLIGDILNKGVLEDGNSLLVQRNSSLPSASDLSQLISKSSLTTQNGSTSSNSNSNNSSSNTNKNTNTNSSNLNTNQNNTNQKPAPLDINNPPEGSQSDKISDMIDTTDRKPPPDSLDKDDWLPGDGTKEAVKKALRRIEKRDPLRYKMIFKMVDHIGDVPGGGLCKGCGDIYVDRKAKIYDISHILVHEATHSGHACTVGWEGFSMAQIEAIAVANQMGSLKRESVSKDDTDPAKNKDKYDDMKQMREFPGQSKEITYKSIPVRGFLCRYLDKVSPAGDLGSWVLQHPRDYAVITHGYANVGPYVYGDPEAGITLNLAQSEETVIETIIKKTNDPKYKCESSPPKDLPPVKECEGAPEIQID